MKRRVFLNIINNRKNKLGFLLFIGLLFLSFAQLGCMKFVQVDPPATSITSTQVYESNSSAAAVLTGIYSNLVANSTLAQGQTSIGWLCGASADELTIYAPSEASIYYTNSYTPVDNDFWSAIYQEIYVANAAIEGLANSVSVSPALKDQLLGEGKFMRAFLHFYATNLFGDVALVTTTNYQVNNTISRSPQSLVYQQIVADLSSAQSLLSDNFLDPTGATTTERVRPNKGAATALLARVYLYEQKWDSAKIEATSVINNSTLYSLDTLNGVFLMNSNEAIWQLQSVIPGYNTTDAYFYVLTSDPGTGNFTVALSTQLTNSFEPGDSRFTNWVGNYTDPNSNQVYYYPYKYKANSSSIGSPVTEYLMVLRLAEQYLIRAEAEAMLGDLPDAATDLNIIRTRAGLNAISNAIAGNQTTLLTAIYHERQIELFTEWGHRWFDLQRTDSINSVMATVEPLKGGTWSSYRSLFPVPLSEIELNGNLTQNPGYNQ